MTITPPLKEKICCFKTQIVLRFQCLFTSRKLQKIPKGLKALLTLEAGPLVLTCEGFCVFPS